MDSTTNGLTYKEVTGGRYAVLDQGYIELLDYMPHPATGVPGDLAIVNAARVSFMGESKGENADKKLLFYLLRNQHTSPFEQVQFKFRIHAPLLVWWQWIRHRTFHYQSVNSQSGRYTEFDEDAFYLVLAHEWRLQSASNKQGSHGLLLDVNSAASAGLSQKLGTFYALGYSLYKEALELGVAKEQARLFLPGFATYYTWVVSVDALNLMNFLRLRMADDAQFEIRQYATIMYQRIFKPLLPWTAEAFEQYVIGKGE